MPDRRDKSEDSFADRDVEVSHDLASFVAELRRLADSLEQGEAFTIEVDGEMIAVPPHARMSVAHEREEGDVELEFQLTWSEFEDEDEEDEDEDEEDEEEDEDDEAEEDEAAGDAQAMPKVAAA
jgi:amphi-Trp domain-containing protein